MPTEYKTRDMYLASYLVMHGLALVKLERDGKRFSFVFSEVPRLKELADEFYSRKAQVEPMQYTMAMKQVKSQMYNQVT